MTDETVPAAAERIIETVSAVTVLRPGDPGWVPYGQLPIEPEMRRRRG